jgi:predicted ArsR family transcriptional regulator
VSEETNWDDRLRNVLTDDWQSADAIAARLNAKHFTVLARLKDMMRRNLVERRIVKKKASVPAGKGRTGQALQQAEFRRIPLGRQTPQEPTSR